MTDADGSVLIEVNLDASKADKELGKLKKKIVDTEKAISETQQKRDDAHQKEIISAAELDTEKAKLQEIRDRLQEIQTLSKDKTLAPALKQEYADMLPGVKAELADQQIRVRGLQTEYNKIARSVERYDEKLKQSKADLNNMTETAGELVQQINAAGGSAKRMGEATKKADGILDRFSKRVKGLITRVFVFTLITQALRSMREWLGKVIRTNSEATAAIAKLKGALLTLAQPLVEVIVPAFTALVNILTKIVSAIARLIAVLFGKTISGSKEAAKNLNKEAKALEATGSAAEEAAGSLAGFDEINTIQTENKGGGGGSAIEPDFSFDTDMSEADLGKLLNLMKAIGAAILAWKLGDGMLDSLQKFVGLMLAIDGAVGLVSAAMDAWNNGLNWDNLLQILGRAAELVLGLWIAFGKIGAAVGLIASGITLLAVSFHDAYVNGWNLQNLLGSIAGIMAAGLGISLLTGTWIPLLIAGIASLLLAITTTYGDGAKLIEDTMGLLRGFKDFFVGVFTGDIEQAMKGIGEIFDSLRGIVGNVVDAVKNMFNSFLDWLDEKTQGKISGLIEWVREYINSHFETISEMLTGFLDGIQLAFEGLIEFFTGVFTGDWELAWKGVQDIFKGAWNAIISIAEGAANLAIDAVNALIKGFNKILGMGDKNAEAIFVTTLRVPTIPRVSIPRLATGGVIPPNREFMAVLGDQRRGYNIEAPEDLIRKIVREEAGGNGEIVALLQELISVARAGHVIKSNDRELGRTVVKTINDMTRQAGKPVLLL